MNEYKKILAFKYVIDKIEIYNTEHVLYYINITYNKIIEIINKKLHDYKYDPIIDKQSGINYLVWTSIEHYYKWSYNYE